MIPASTPILQIRCLPPENSSKYVSGSPNHLSANRRNSGCDSRTSSSNAAEDASPCARHSVTKSDNAATFSNGARRRQAAMSFCEASSFSISSTSTSKSFWRSLEMPSKHNSILLTARAIRCLCSRSFSSSSWLVPTNSAQSSNAPNDKWALS